MSSPQFFNAHTLKDHFSLPSVPFNLQFLMFELVPKLSTEHINCCYKFFIRSDCKNQSNLLLKNKSHEFIDNTEWNSSLIEVILVSWRWLQCNRQFQRNNLNISTSNFNYFFLHQWFTFIEHPWEQSGTRQ